MACVKARGESVAAAVVDLPPPTDVLDCNCRCCSRTRLVWEEEEEDVEARPVELLRPGCERCKSLREGGMGRG